MESIDRRRLLARAVLHVVDRHAIDIDGTRQWRADSYGWYRHAVYVGCFFQCAAIIIKSFNQAVDQVVRTGVRHLADEVRYVDHGVSMQYTQFEVIEK